MFKQNKGITLIALVITIIVLLILAGVSISAVIGENGIATKAKNAAIKTEEAKIEEEILTKIQEMQIEASTSDNEEAIFIDFASLAEGNVYINSNVNENNEMGIMEIRAILKHKETYYAVTLSNVFYKDNNNVKTEIIDLDIVNREPTESEKFFAKTFKDPSDFEMVGEPETIGDTSYIITLKEKSTGKTFYAYANTTEDLKNINIYMTDKLEENT